MNTGQLLRYCPLCNRYMRDKDAFKLHISTHAHRSKQELYLQDPELVRAPYSARLVQDMFSEGIAWCQQARTKSCDLQIIYEKYLQEGRKGGVVYLEATRWNNVIEMAKWMEKQDMCFIISQSMVEFIKRKNHDEDEKNLLALSSSQFQEKANPKGINEEQPLEQSESKALRQELVVEPVASLPTRQLLQPKTTLTRTKLQNTNLFSTRKIP